MCVGVVRVLLIAPVLGETGAVLWEPPALLIVIGVAASRSVRRFDVAPGLPRLAVGAIALALQQTGDVLVATTMRGLTVEAYLADFLTARGVVYAVMLVMFLAAPVIVRAQPAASPLRQINTRRHRPW